MSILRLNSLSTRIAGRIGKAVPYTNTYKATPSVWTLNEVAAYSAAAKWPIKIVRDGLLGYFNANDTASYLEGYNVPGPFGTNEAGLTNLVFQNDFNEQVPGKGKVFGLSMRSGVSNAVGPQLTTDSSANNAKYFAFDGLYDYAIGESPTNRAVYYPTAADTIKNITIVGFVRVTLNERGPFLRVGWYDFDNNDPVVGGADGWSIGIGGATGTADPYGTAGNYVVAEFHNKANFNTTTTWSSGWQMVTMVLNASSQALLYKNTTQVGSTFTGYTPDFPTVFLYLARASGDEPGGDIRSVACGVGNFLFYSKALSADEIAQNYNAFKSDYGLT